MRGTRGLGVWGLWLRAGASPSTAVCHWWHNLAGHPPAAHTGRGLNSTYCSVGGQRFESGGPSDECDGLLGPPSSCCSELLLLSDVVLKQGTTVSLSPLLRPWAPPLSAFPFFTPRVSPLSLWLAYSSHPFPSALPSPSRHHRCPMTERS